VRPSREHVRPRTLVSAMISSTVRVWRGALSAARTSCGDTMRLAASSDATIGLGKCVSPVFLSVGRGIAGGDAMHPLFDAQQRVTQIDSCTV
jgi:hypothetical protein